VRPPLAAARGRIGLADREHLMIVRENLIGRGAPIIELRERKPLAPRAAPELGALGEAGTEREHRLASVSQETWPPRHTF